MIRHIVLYRLHEQAAGGTKAENAALMKQKLEALNGVIEGLHDLQHRNGCHHAQSSSGDRLRSSSTSTRVFSE